MRISLLRQPVAAKLAVALIISSTLSIRASQTSAPATARAPEIIELTDEAAVKKIIGAHLGTPVVVFAWVPSPFADRAIRALQDLQRRSADPFDVVYLAIGGGKIEMSKLPPNLSLPDPLYCLPTTFRIPDVFKGLTNGSTLGFVSEKGIPLPDYPLWPIKDRLDQWRFEGEAIPGMKVSGELTGDRVLTAFQAWIDWHQPSSRVAKLEKAVFIEMVKMVLALPPLTREYQLPLRGLTAIRDLDGWIISGRFRAPAKATGFAGSEGSLRVDSLRVTGPLVETMNR